MAYFANSTILMADGTRKPIENVAYGDYVKDFQGNSKKVIGVKCWNNYTTRNREWWLLNDTFLMTNGNSLFSPDYTINVVGNQSYLYSRIVPYIINANQIEWQWAWIDSSYSSKRTPIAVGATLLKENNQTEVVTSIVDVTSTHSSNNITTYNLSVEGGTAWINGYLTIFRHDEKFDFSTMQPCSNAVITLNQSSNTYSRILDSSTINYSTFSDLIWNNKDERWHPASYFIS